MPEPPTPIQTFTEYAAAVASSAPTPGGGSVIANVAALAASLAEMVCNLTLGKSDDGDAQYALANAQQSVAELRHHFQALALADETAYGSYRAAAKLPRSTTKEKATRQVALETALVASTDVPLHIARNCLDLLHTLEIIATHGTKHALADAHTSRRFAYAALENALDMTTANTTLMKNRDHASTIDHQLHDLHAQAQTAHATVTQTLDSRSS